jgi:peptidoglycan/xylan/chitin deacetylase (PgdA/CDA1 family)
MLPEHAYITRVETLSDGSAKIHTMNRMYLDNWKDNPEDYKLLAFTFDDGPAANDTKFIDLFAKYKGSATFFVTGSSCNSAGYSSLQYAINNGWDIGNHSMTHADAHNGKKPTDPAYTELSYEELKYQISDMNTLLESNLKMADGVTPYEVALYRPPQIRTTDNVFKICEEENMPVIWLSQNTYDWDSTKDYAARLQNMKNGVGAWIDGDVILGHVWSNDTYNAMVETFDAFYDAGYRFCSITELMEYRGIERSDISGKLNEVDGNQGRVKNIVKSATYGKAEN